MRKNRIFGNSMSVQNILEGLDFQVNKGEDKTMNWTTIYISGKEDFRSEVRKKLEHGDQRFMPGYIENSSALHTHDLYWLDGRTSVRLFKEAIGAKLIWKYRLRFFTSLEDFLAFENGTAQDGFTEDELSRIAAMHALEDRAA